MLDTFVFDKKAQFLPGAETALRMQRSINRRLTLLGGNIVGNSRSESSGVCARVRRGGMYGFSSVAGCTPEAVDAVIRAAGENAEFMDERLRRGKPALAGVPGDRVTEVWDAADPSRSFISTLRGSLTHISRGNTPTFPAAASLFSTRASKR